jgi:phosphoglycerate kinase
MKLRSFSPSLLKGRRVLVRADLNVPLEKGHVADDTRLERLLPLLRELRQASCRVVIISHLGRPHLEKNPEQARSLSLKPVAARLGELLPEVVVQFCPDTTGSAAHQAVEKLGVGDVLVLENLRFYPGEKKNDAHFAQQLSKLGDAFINDAFSTAHRAHASTVGITKYLPSFAGPSLLAEVEALEPLITKPARPFIVVVGGAKISDKASAIINLAAHADAILIGGGVANLFLQAEGYPIGDSFVQDAPADLKKTGVNFSKIAHGLLERTRAERILLDSYIPVPKLLYPLDVVTAASPSSQKTTVIDLVDQDHKMLEKAVKDQMFLDIGPKTIRLYKELILGAATVFWNGPMGFAEKTPFAHGTKEIATAIARSSATTILGGGDTVAAATQLGLKERYDYVSAAGSAALEFLAGNQLPGLVAIQKKGNR